MQNHIFKVDSEKSTERDSTETKAGQRKNKLLSNCIGTTTPPQSNNCSTVNKCCSFYSQVRFLPHILMFLSLLSFCSLPYHSTWCLVLFNENNEFQICCSHLALPLVCSDTHCSNILPPGRWLYLQLFYHTLVAHSLHLHTPSWNYENNRFSCFFLV